MKKKKRRSGKWLPLVLFSLTGAMCGLFGADYLLKTITGGDSLAFKLTMVALFVVLLYLVMLIQIIVHEAGHLVFGRLSGYTLASFRIGSLMLVKKNGKYQLKRYSLMGTGGQCLMNPPESHGVNPPYDEVPYLLYNLGGSLANLFVAIVAEALSFLTGRWPVLSLFLLLMTVIGIAFALINGIPLHLGLVDNDGYNAWNLGKNREARRCFWLQMRINAQITDGVRLKDMPDEWFVMPSNEALTSGLCATIGVFACDRAIDAKDFEAAKRIGWDLLQNASGLIGVHRCLVTSEMVYCELTGDNRKAVIEKMFTKDFRKYLKVSAKNPSLIRMLYAHDLFFNNDEKAADKQLQTFEKISAAYPHPSEIDSERELIALTRSLYKAPATKTS